VYHLLVYYHIYFLSRVLCYIPTVHKTVTRKEPKPLCSIANLVFSYIFFVVGCHSCLHRVKYDCTLVFVLKKREEKQIDKKESVKKV
jgi:hypothetical protein